MTKTQPTEVMTSPWDPCDDLDALASRLQTTGISAAELWADYQRHHADDVRRWLEFNLDPDYGDRFHKRMDGLLNDLREWEERWLEDGEEKPGVDIEDGLFPLKIIRATSLDTSKWLHQLSAMIKAKSGTKAVPVVPATSPDRPKLNATDKAAGRFIKKSQPVTATEVANAINIGEQHFYKNIVPRLRPYGLDNDHNRDGYFFPDGTGVDEG